MDERHQRERLGRRVVDGDVVRRPELLQHQHVGVGEHQEEAFDHQDRQRGAQPKLKS